jgi:hypothetical protein
MDATLNTLRGIEKSIQTPLPAPPIWDLSTTDVDAQVCLQYPTFTGSQTPQIQFKVNALHNKNLLAQLAGDPKQGFSPPYKFTLIRAGDPFHDKKQHTETRRAWSKGDWAWSPKFNCRQKDKNVSLRIDSTSRKNVKKVAEFQALFQARESLHELRNHLWVEFGKLLQEKTASYENFLSYCGLAQLHHIDKQRKKVESHMVDVYESWTNTFSNKVLV